MADRGGIPVGQSRHAYQLPRLQALAEDAGYIVAREIRIVGPAGYLIPDLVLRDRSGEIRLVIEYKFQITGRPSALDAAEQIKRYAAVFGGCPALVVAWDLTSAGAKFLALEGIPSMSLAEFVGAMRDAAHALTEATA